MRKIEWVYHKMWFGPFNPKKKNVALFFQLNCPGCFLNAFPLMDWLYERAKDVAGFVAVSTSFEDFDINNIKNTEDFVLHKTHFGQTKLLFNSIGTKPYVFEGNYPVCFDKLLPAEEFLTEKNIDLICQSVPAYQIWPEFEKKDFRKNILNYYKKQPRIAYMFNLLQLKGTPSFVFFDFEWNVRNCVFGIDEYDYDRYLEYLKS